MLCPAQEKKGERIREKRGEQKELMKSVVQRVLGEFIKAGRLGENELDAAAKGVLEKMEAKVMGMLYYSCARAWKAIVDLSLCQVFFQPNNLVFSKRGELQKLKRGNKTKGGTRPRLTEAKIQNNIRAMFEFYAEPVCFFFLLQYLLMSCNADITRAQKTIR